MVEGERKGNEEGERKIECKRGRGREWKGGEGERQEECKVREGG